MNNKGSVLIFVLILIVLLVVGGLSLVFIFGKNLLFNRNLPNSSPSVSQSVSPSQVTYQNEFLKANLPRLITSEFQSYPLAVAKPKKESGELTHELLLIPINSEISSPIETKIPVESSGFSLNQGSKDPRSSPDLKVIAYISNQTLGLISGDGKNRVELPDKLKVEYITRWSPDSRKILIYSLADNIQGSTEGMGGPPDIVQFDPLRWPGGFYLVDLDKGEVRLIPQLDGVVDWIDSDKILAVTHFTGDWSDLFAIFDLNSYTADFKTLAGSFSKYFGIHFSFSQNSKKWALSLGNTGNNQETESFSNIIIADFPDTKGIEIDKGQWADVQHPLISPDGEKVVYSRGSGANSTFAVWIDNKVMEGEKGYAEMWIDNDKFIYRVSDEGKTPKIYIYNTAAKSSTPLNP